MTRKSTSSLASLFGDTGNVYLYALGICIMAGKQITNWHLGIGAYGFYMFLISLTFTSISYIILTCNFAEMVSIIPFSGGSYGYTRCTLGPTVGYVVGMMEAAKYMVFALLAGYTVGVMLQEAFDFAEHWLPVIWLAYFVLINVTVSCGVKYLWWFWGLLALGVLLTQSIFVFGAIKYGEAGNLGSRFNELHTGGDSGGDFLKNLSLSLYLISGIDAMRSCANDRSNRVVPHAMVIVMVGIIVMGYVQVVAMRSYVLNPYKLLLYTFSYNVGLEQTLPDVPTKYLALFSLAGTFGNGYGFLYGGARQVRSMAGSGLLPAFLTYSQTKEQVESEEKEMLPSKDKEDSDCNEKEIKPTMALLVCSLFCYALLLVGYYKIDTFSRKFSRMCTVLAVLQTSALMLAYCVFAVRFSNLERRLRSPFHIPGAFIVIGYFITVFFTVFYYEDHSENYGYALVIFFVSIMIYYYLVASKRQFFSKEEQEKFMKAYVVNANKRKKASSKKSALRTMAERLSVMTGFAVVAGMKSMSASQDPDSRLSGSLSPERVGTGSPGRSVIIKTNTKVVPVVEIRRTEST
eukprot:scaffold381_cov168-Ochromonas_danica.AAC.23